MIYQEEPLSSCMEGIKLLVREHWLEVANHQDSRPLDINWDQYLTFPHLHVFTMREDNKLVGYAAFFVAYHPHYQTCKQAVSDVYYVHPDYRGEPSVNFFKFIEERLKQQDVKLINVQDKVHKSRERFFQYLGYKTVEQVYEKVL